MDSAKAVEYHARTRSGPKSGVWQAKNQGT